MVTSNRFLAAACLWTAFVTALTVGGTKHRPLYARESHGNVGKPTAFYVSPAGKDDAPGTEAAPFATLHRAVEATRAATGPRKIVLLPGTYYLASSINLGPEDSGLVIEGVRGRQTILSGGRRITNWRPWKGDILQADLTNLDLSDFTFRETYYNAKLQSWARVPNADPKHPRTGGFLQNAGIVEKDTKTKLRYREGDLEPEKWLHPERAWVMFHDSLNYETQYCKVRNIDPEKRVIEASRGVYLLSTGNPSTCADSLKSSTHPGSGASTRIPRRSTSGHRQAIPTTTTS